MTDEIRYVAYYDRHNKIDGLGRIISNEKGLTGEMHHAGQWIKSDYVAEAVCFPADDRSLISHEEAMEVAKALGIKAL